MNETVFDRQNDPVGYSRDDIFIGYETRYSAGGWAWCYAVFERPNGTRYAIADDE